MSEFSVHRTADRIPALRYCLVLDGTRIAGGKPDYRGSQSLDGVAVEVDGALHVAQTGNDWWCVACGDCMAQGPKVKAPRDRAAVRAVQAWNERNGEGRLF